MNVAIANPDGFPRPATSVGGALNPYPREDGDRQEMRNRILARVGRDRDVLELGTGTFADELRASGCRVEVVGAPNFAEGPEDRRFDAVIAAEALGGPDDPEAVLQMARRALRPGGAFIASVPNVAHGSVRLALLRGHFPSGERGVLDPTHLRYFTRDSLIRRLEGAGFAIGHLEAMEQPIVEADGSDDSDGAMLPNGLADELSRDPEARASRFIVVAHPLPDPGLDWIQGQFRELSAENEEARRELEDLRRVVNSMNTHLAFLSQQAKREADRANETRERLLEAQYELVRRDADHRVTVGELIAEKEGLVARLEALRQSLPGRVYRKARAVLAFGRR